MADSPTLDAPRSRRALLTAAAGGAAALAVSAIRPGHVDAASVAVMTEVENPTGATTSIVNSQENGLGFLAQGNGAGLHGASAKGTGVQGLSPNSTDPATDTRNTGVVGIAGNEGDTAPNRSLTGVYGYSDPSTTDGFVGSGVWGDSPDVGVIGTGGIGTFGDGVWGALGLGRGSGGIGLYGRTDNAQGRALRVEGRAEFTRSGRAAVSSGATKKVVTLAGCTTYSLVFAVMNTNESGRWVRAVVPAAGAFTVWFNAALTSSATIIWIAFTNPANHSG